MTGRECGFLKIIAIFWVIWATISVFSQFASHENEFIIKPKPARRVRPLDLRQNLGNDAWRYIPSGLSYEQTQMLLTRLQQASKVTKYIIIFHFWTPKLTGKMKNICGNCEFTTDPKMMDHPDTKAVVIGYRYFNWTFLRKLERRQDQLFVWLTGESPESLRTVHGKTFELETKFKFNLTETYRRDSGVYHPYGDFTQIYQEKLKQRINKNISVILQKKTRMAVAVISNCGATSGAGPRLKIIKKLKALGLQIDTFGRCFNHELKEKRADFLKLLGKYKFYLSFENAFHCRDYITEKFLHSGHKSGAVPVALGATKSEYEAVAPKGSFIFMEDFSSLFKLVKYLKYLDQHDEKYLKYFRWIEGGHASLPEPKVTGFCRLCRMIHGINVDDIQNPGYNKEKPAIPMFTDDIAPRNVANLKKWIFNTEHPDCFRKDVEPINRLLRNVN